MAEVAGGSLRVPLQARLAEDARPDAGCHLTKITWTGSAPADAISPRVSAHRAISPSAITSPRRSAGRGGRPGAGATCRGAPALAAPARGRGRDLERLSVLGLQLLARDGALRGRRAGRAVQVTAAAISG